MLLMLQNSILVLMKIKMMPDADTPFFEENGSPSWAEMYSYEFNLLYNHLVNVKGCDVWLWGDRLLNHANASTGYPMWNLGSWESDSGTEDLVVHSAIDLIPRENMLITDWHYNSSPNTAEYFASKGFYVISATGNGTDINIGVQHLNHHLNAAPEISYLMKGICFTTWQFRIS